MREIRPSGSEGGEDQANGPSLPLSQKCSPVPPAVETEPLGSPTQAGSLFST